MAEYSFLFFVTRNEYKEMNKYPYIARILKKSRFYAKNAFFIPHMLCML